MPKGSENKLKSSHAGNKSYQLTSAGQSALGWQVSRHGLAGSSYFLFGRILISYFSEPLAINTEILNGLLALVTTFYLNLFWRGVLQYSNVVNFLMAGSVKHNEIIFKITR